MIKIRYAELPAGLHIQTLNQGRDMVLYLLPGLTPGQRRAALRRARGSARVGHGPPLPPLEMAVALALDQIRTTLGNGLGAIRTHPSFLIPAAVVAASVAVAYLLAASATFGLRPPRAAGTRPGGTSAGPALALAPKPGPRRPVPGSRPHQPPVLLPVPGTPGRPPGLTAGPIPVPSTPVRPGPTIAPSLPAPTPGPSLSAAPVPGSSPGPHPVPTPAPIGGCAQVGPLGFCVRT